jgi:sulfonate transport system substrate-binding protein
MLGRRHLLGMGLASGLLAACAKPTQTVHVRVGYQKSGVLLLAKARGGLEAALSPLGSVRVEWLEFVAGPPMLESMRAGAIDIGAVGDTPPIFAQAGGVPFVYAGAIPNADAAEAVIVPAASPIKAVADLRGVKVGLTKGSSSHLLLIEALKTANLTMTDIKPVFLAPPDAASAFAAGAIDAWAIWDPYLALAENRGPTRTLIDRGALPPSNSYILAYRPFAEKTPKVLSAVLDFLAAQSAWGNAHVADAAAIMASQTGLPVSIATQALRRAPLALTPVTAKVVERQQAAADLFSRQGFIPAPVTVADAVWSGWPGAPS